MLGYCISLSRCYWRLELVLLHDECVGMMKQAIASWGCGKGRIATVEFTSGWLTSNGVDHLLSLPHNTLSHLIALDLSFQELDSKSCEVLAHCLPSLPHLELLSLEDNQIGCDGTHLLSQSLDTNITLRYLFVSGNIIGDRGGCSLAKALSINKSLEVLFLFNNPLGEKSIQELICSLLVNHTLHQMWLPSKWKEFSQGCVGYSQAESRLRFY